MTEWECFNKSIQDKVSPIWLIETRFNLGHAPCLRHRAAISKWWSTPDKYSLDDEWHRTISWDLFKYKDYLSSYRYFQNTVQGQGSAIITFKVRGSRYKDKEDLLLAMYQSRTWLPLFLQKSCHAGNWKLASVTHSIQDIIGLVL